MHFCEVVDINLQLPPLLGRLLPRSLLTSEEFNHLWSPSNGTEEERSRILLSETLRRKGPKALEELQKQVKPLLQETSSDTKYCQLKPLATDGGRGQCSSVDQFTVLWPRSVRASSPLLDQPIIQSDIQHVWTHDVGSMLVFTETLVSTDNRQSTRTYSWQQIL